MNKLINENYEESNKPHSEFDSMKLVVSDQIQLSDQKRDHRLGTVIDNRFSYTDEVVDQPTSGVGSSHRSRRGR